MTFKLFNKIRKQFINGNVYGCFSFLFLYSFMINIRLNEPTSFHQKMDFSRVV